MSGDSSINQRHCIFINCIMVEYILIMLQVRSRVVTAVLTLSLITLHARLMYAHFLTILMMSYVTDLLTTLKPARINTLTSRHGGMKPFVVSVFNS